MKTLKIPKHLSGDVKNNDRTTETRAAVGAHVKRPLRLVKTEEKAQRIAHERYGNGDPHHDLTQYAVETNEGYLEVLIVAPKGILADVHVLEALDVILQPTA